MVKKLFRSVASWLRRSFPLPELPALVSLRTERLLVRDLRDEDLPALLAFLGDPQVLRYLQRTEPLSRDEVWGELCSARYLQWQEPRYHYDLGIVLPESEQLIGKCSLSLMLPNETAREANAATIGFLIRRDQWGQGYASEAARAVLGLAFGELGLPCVFGGCHPENTASRRVLERLGMSFQGSQADFAGAPEGVEALVFCIEREQWLDQSGPGYDFSLDS
jgi:RimJ/RimL family protein N-acetyltransferase